MNTQSNRRIVERVVFMWSVFYGMRICWALCVSPSAPQTRSRSNEKLLAGVDFYKVRVVSKKGFCDFLFCGLTISSLLSSVYYLIQQSLVFIFLMFSVKSRKLLLAFTSVVVPNVSPRLIKLNSMVWVRERTTPTEQPPHIGELIANFCG
jgi:hypothetical protein